MKTNSGGKHNKSPSIQRKSSKKAAKICTPTYIRKIKNNSSPGLIMTVLVVGSILGVIALFSTHITFQASLVDGLPMCEASHETYFDLNINATIGNYKNYSVAVDNARCSAVGKDILIRNGSVVDAAIAAGLCNGIMNAHSTGIGGGHFMVIYLKDKNAAYAIDSREAAPLSASKLMFKDASSLSGGLATAIPGEIYGYWEAHKLGGRLPWKTLFQPAIAMCRNGFRASKILARVIAKSENEIRSNVALSKIFVNSVTNETYKENELIKMPNLANTLELISENNITAFYNSKLTKLMVREINQNGGRVTLEDFRNYKALVTPAIKSDLDGQHKLLTTPLPSSGVLLPFILKIVNGFDLEKSGSDDKIEQTLYYHRLVETFKHAYAHRTQLGDEVDSPVIDAVLKKLDDPEYLKSIRAKISDFNTYPASFYTKNLFKEDKGTAHISIMANGDAVSLTSSINTYFGAKYAGAYTGIIYNNQMDDFSTPDVPNFYGLDPSEANFIKPGKRPMSSMCPVIIVDENKDAKLVLGASGGSKILTAVSQVAIKVLWQSKNLKEAIDDKRIHHQLLPDHVQFEDGFDLDIHKYIRALGHQTSCFENGGSVIQGIHRVSPVKITAYSDPRKGGLSDGF